MRARLRLIDQVVGGLAVPNAPRPPDQLSTVLLYLALFAAGVGWWLLRLWFHAFLVERAL